MAEALEVQQKREGVIESPRRSAYWIFFWFAVVAVASKGVLVEWPAAREPWAKWDQAITKLRVLAYRDVLFAVCAGTLCGGALWLARRSGRVRGLWRGMLVLGAAMSVWSIASAAAIWFLRGPVTWGIIDLVGLRNVPGVALKHGGWGHWVAAVVVAIVYLQVVPVFERKCPAARGGWRWMTWGSTAAALLLVGLSHRYLKKEWPAAEADGSLLRSPHWDLLKSTADRLVDRKVTVGGTFEPGDLEDFRPPHANVVGPTDGLRRGPKNVILVVLESVGARWMSLYGSEYRTTPRLEAEAKHAAVFTAFHSLVTNSGNALAPMLVGEYPPLTWRERMLDDPAFPAVALPDVLHARGYRTAFVSSCDFDYNGCLAFLRHRKFDVVQDYRDFSPKKTTMWGVDDRHMVDMALRFIDEGGDRNKPFFVMCWNQGTHWDYAPAEGVTPIEFGAFGDGRYGKMGWDLDRYLNAVHYMDAQLGRLFDELRRRGIADDTMVVIVGDHGIGFGHPHEGVGHTARVYGEDVNVPLILWNPRAFAGERVKTTGGMVDLPATVCDVLGVPWPGRWQGKSLFSPSHPNRAYFYGCGDLYLMGVRDGDWKYVFNTTHWRDELYDLSVDPDEQRNLATGDGARVRRMRQRLAAWVNWQLR